MMLLKDFLKEINDWQDSVFTKATPLSAAIHLQREAKELVTGMLHKESQEHLAEEMADIFFLLAGVSHLMEVDLVLAVQKKFEINKAREWGKPDADGVVEHIEPQVNFMRVDSNGKPYGIGRTD